MRLRSPRSLFAQLALSQALLIALVATILPLLLAYLLHNTANNFISDRLLHDAKVIAGRLPSQPTTDEPGRLISNTLNQTRNRGRGFAVFNADGSVVAAGRSGPPVPLAETPHGRAPVYSKRGRFDVLSMPINRAPGTTQWVVVAQDRTAPEEIVDDVVGTFVRQFIWIVPASLLLSALIGLVIVRSVTGNFRRAASQADAISLDRIGVRLEPSDLPREAAPLVAATNRALDRLEAGYRYQGEFIGNVAHELRTPLALISLRTEGLDPSPDRDLIQLGVERANHVIRQLMELAAIDRHRPVVTAFSSLDLVMEVGSVMAPLVFQKDHSLAFDEPEVPPAPVMGVPGLVEIALTNLIDNAVRHTPAGCSIIVSVEPDGSIVVEDDGPGMTIENYDDRSRRFRATGTNRSDSAGIGLAIVERIMTACGGELVLGGSAAGGARCLLKLPPAAAEKQRPA